MIFLDRKSKGNFDLSTLLTISLTLISLLFADKIQAQNFTTYFTGNTVDEVRSPEGGTCLMGGASEDDNGMKWFLNRADGGDVLVLRASGSDGYNDYLYNELGISVNSVETIVFNNASASQETYIHEKIKKAEAIWFAGGDQWDYITYWRDTPVDSLINEGILQRNIVIGGTSAGMAVLGRYYFTAENGTVTSSQALNNPYRSKMTVSNSPFIETNFLSNVITDTHYDDPDRRGRHSAFLARMMTDYSIFPKGIAAEEYAAICIDENGVAQVFGDASQEDFAYFIRPNCNLQDMQPEVCAAGQRLTWNHNGEALIVYKVKGTENGSNTFNVRDWKAIQGGTWEFWYVNNGSFKTSTSSETVCSGDESNAMVVLENGSLYLKKEDGLIIKGKDGKCYTIGVSAEGVLEQTEVACPQ